MVHSVGLLFFVGDHVTIVKNKHIRNFCGRIDTQH